MEETPGNKDPYVFLQSLYHSFNLYLPFSGNYLTVVDSGTISSLLVGSTNTFSINFAPNPTASNYLIF